MAPSVTKRKAAWEGTASELPRSQKVLQTKQTPPKLPPHQRPSSIETFHFHHQSLQFTALLNTKYITMDIEEILRQVDPTSHGVPNETRDLQALTRLWIAERSAPELLE